MFSRDGDMIVSHIKKFLGPRASINTLVCKADAAKEFQDASEQLGAFYEPSIERFWPHNSRLERDIRTFEESVRATHLASGFAAPIIVAHHSSVLHSFTCECLDATRCSATGW